MSGFDLEEINFNIDEHFENNEEDSPQNENILNANAPEMLAFGLLANSLSYNVISPIAEDVEISKIKNHILEAMKSPTQHNLLIEHAPGLHGTALTLTLVLENLRKIQAESEGIEQAQGASSSTCSSTTSKKVFLCTNHQTYETFKVIQDIQTLSEEGRRLEGFQIVYLHETKVQGEGHSTEGTPVYSAYKINHLPQNILEELQYLHLPIPPTDTQADLNLEILEHADVIICNQKFVLSPILQKILKLKLEKSIVIFEDGHNIVDSCKNILTLSLTNMELELICSRIKNLQRRHNFLNNPDADPEEAEEQRTLAPLFTQLVNKLPDLSKWFAALNVAERSNGPILTQLKKLGFNHENLTELATRIFEQFRSNDHDHDQDDESDRNLKFEVLEKLANFLLILPAVLQDDGINFRLNVDVRGRNNDKVKTLQIYCAIADLVFKPVGAMASMVIISGHSLAPYSGFDTGTPGSGIGVNFSLLLQIFYRKQESKNRFLFISTAYGPRRSQFNLSYRQRDDPHVKREVIEALLQICNEVPNGVVLLFHSKSYLQNSLLVPLIAQLERVCNKHVICELYVQNESPAQVLERFKHLSKNPGEGKTGAIFISLHRGSFYPKMDLRGAEVRATVHVSMPFGDSVNGDDHATMRTFFRALHPDNLPVADGMWSNWNNKECMNMLNQSYAQTYQGSEENEDEWGMVIVLDSIFSSRTPNLFDLVPLWVELCTSRHFSDRGDFELLMGHVRQLVTTFNTVRMNLE